MKYTVEIPAQLVNMLFRYASESGVPLEDIIETAFRHYMERNDGDA